MLSSASLWLFPLALLILAWQIFVDGLACKRRKRRWEPKLTLRRILWIDLVGIIWFTRTLNIQSLPINSSSNWLKSFLNSFHCNLIFVTNWPTNNTAHPAWSRMNVGVIHSFLSNASVACPKASFRSFHHLPMCKERCGPFRKLPLKPVNRG